MSNMNLTEELMENINIRKYLDKKSIRVQVKNHGKTDSNYCCLQ